MFNILLPTDFSDNAQKAIDYAIYLFDKEECTFYLLHAYYDVPSASDTKFNSENELKHLVEGIASKNENPKHHFERVFLTDSVVNALNITIIDKAVDYIFMGTKGASSLRNIFMGSNTVRVIKQLDTCPIVAVPADYDYDLPDEIAFANDFKHTFIAIELVPLINFTQLWNSTLLVVHIRSEKKLSNDQKLNKELLKNALKEVKIRFLEVQMEVSISSTLYRLEKENKKIGMVALLKIKRGFFEKLLREPVIRNISFNTKVPLLVLSKIE